MTTSLHDLHECYSKKDPVTGKVVKRWVSTIAYNLPYRICRHKKKVYETLPNYPKGTFFIITENGKRPKI